ncbi:MAG: XTP/dITP diphosphatase [Clostridium sp.]|jgi:XTP/dITP diphosphohydrolase|nr:XTP/dITP diphosphatase [Clostridium sp.]
MKKIILASNNAHKIEEIKKILEGLPFEIKSLKDENINIDIEEDGNTFEENAKKKASEIANFLKNRGEKEFIVMADDSGLEVDYLNGEPGIYSARYAGEHGNDKKNNEKLLKELKGVPKEKRGAQFVCQIVLVNENDKYLSIRGEVRGRILEELSGKEGFGYDPLFFYAPLNKTFGELSSEEKNSVSHRACALKELKNRIKEIIN